MNVPNSGYVPGYNSTSYTFGLCSFSVAPDFFISPTATVKMPKAYEGELVRKIKGGVATFYLYNMGEKEIRMDQIINMDKTKGPSVGHLAHAPTDDALRTLALTVVFQSSETPPPPMYLENRQRRTSLESFSLWLWPLSCPILCQ